MTVPPHPDPDKALLERILEEIRAQRREHAAMRRLLDQFCGALLNAKYPFGQATDRWRRR